MSASPEQLKFKPEIVKKILDKIAEGTPYKIAAESTRVADSTFYKWIHKGLEDLAAGIESKHVDLVEALREIERKRITTNLREIRATEKGHRGCEWELERSFWKYFSAQAQNIDLNERIEKLEKSKEEK